MKSEVGANKYIFPEQIGYFYCERNNFEKAGDFRRRASSEKTKGPSSWTYCFQQRPGDSIAELTSRYDKLKITRPSCFYKLKKNLWYICKNIMHTSWIGIDEWDKHALGKRSIIPYTHQRIALVITAYQDYVNILVVVLLGVWERMLFSQSH